ANIGKDAAIFEAVHGSAPDIAGKGIANPAALLMAAVLMLEHLEMRDEAGRIKRALESAVRENDTLTPDLGGTGTTDTFADALIRRL
ncbi:MAG TPA: isocitrate/isopropylmalate family dehydrogenase, partial [Longimicrobium sp.]|nr:isocitrate/isopropylmalate family dehydrogenase [Longimicrobium sp.]